MDSVSSQRSTLRKVVDVTSVEHAAAVIRAMRSVSHAKVSDYPNFKNYIITIVSTIIIALHAEMIKF